MVTAKDIVLKPIDAQSARAFVKRVHYSGKVVNNSQLHIGAFLNDKLEGVMSFGPSLDKRKVRGLVKDTGWNEFLELNRMAFSDKLPRNSESRALGVAMRMLKKHAPQVKWVISFADATQCGDRTIYRASGFILTGIKENNQIWIAPDDGEVFTRMVATDTRRPEYYRLQEKATHARFSRMSLSDNRSHNEQEKARQIIARVSASKGNNIINSGARGGSSMKSYIEAGFKPLEGFQLRYVYFIDPAYRVRLTVPELPFSEIERRGASMYKGEKITRASAEVETGGLSKSDTGGAIPTDALRVNNG